MSWNRPRKLHGLPRQNGSAYIVALLALVVLTIIGLALALITQTEMLVGANERTIQRVFYAADSGINMATARALGNDFEEHTETFSDPDSPAVVNAREVVDTTPFTEINQQHCDLCGFNRCLEYQADCYYHLYYAVEADAERVAGASNTSLAQRGVSSIVEIQPRKPNVFGLSETIDRQSSDPTDMYIHF